jgi:hypothetical protein
MGRRPRTKQGQAKVDVVGCELDLHNASYFLSKIELRPGAEPTMALWRKRLFIATSYITADAAEHFGLPRERTGHHGLTHRCMTLFGRRGCWAKFGPGLGRRGLRVIRAAIPGSG